MIYMRLHTMLLAAGLAFAAATAGLSAGPTSTPTSAPAADWPQFRGPDRDGISPATGLLTHWPEAGPKLLWSLTDIGLGFTHAVVAGDTVYVNGLVDKDGVLHAYSLDGKPKWNAPYGPEYFKDYPGARSVPTVAGGMVYLTTGFGVAWCFDAATGKPVWTVDVFARYEAPPVKWGYAESLLVDGDKVFVTPCGKKGTMVALDRKTGAAVWASPDLGHKSSFCSPVMIQHGQRRMIVTLTDQAVVAFNPADGAVIWQHPYQNFRQNHPVSPLYHDGLLYVTSGYGKGAICLELAADGGGVKQLWEQPKQDPIHGQAVLVDGCVYASSNQTSAGKWSCVQLKTGKLLWEEAGPGKAGSVIAADGLLYCYTEDGIVGLVKPSADKCQVVSTFKVSAGEAQHWAHLAIADGKLFVRHGNALLCYDISATHPSESKKP